jgi:DNA adenine methylase
MKPPGFGRGSPLVDENRQAIVPFLKWAGGKRWLAPHLRSAVPEKYGTYFEPFLGGAAIFFLLRPKKAVLSDVNEDLIATYIAIRENHLLVRRYLGVFAKEHGKLHYYQQRETNSRSRFRNAARFIYLNRVCWNGLYRVNLKGKFNVPLGTKTAVLLDSDNFPLVSEALQSATLYARDFEKTIDAAEKDDFVFVDPPYITAHNFNGFIKYNEKLFGWEDQVRLKDCVQRAKNRGVKLLIANADHDSIRKLYSGVGKLAPIARSSVIAGSSAHRQETTELLIQLL